MRRLLVQRLILLAVGAGLCAVPAPAAAKARAPAPSLKKAIWGPTRTDAGKSLFPTYRSLGVGIFEIAVSWSDIAPTRPADPSDPNDPAYQWPEDVDFAVKEGARYGIRVALVVTGAPPWANGGKPPNWAPTDPQDFATFIATASRRWPAVRYWMVWGEPTRQANFMPLYQEEKRGRPLTFEQAEGVRRYAEILDASYATLKAANPANFVIGGNTFTGGDISTKNFIPNLRLPDGRPPRMDMYGHNPFTGRKPDLKKPPLPEGFADFSDLDTLAGWIDKNLKQSPSQKPIKLFLSEFSFPTDHPNFEFNFYVSHKTQAQWLTLAYRIARKWSRIYTLGWLQLYDQAPNAKHDEVHNGLIEHGGKKKQSYTAYKNA